jgi:hypothetical protein
MKYLITESQIDKVIFKYLDNQDFVRHQSSSVVHFLNPESELLADSLINYYWSGECFIDFLLIDEIARFFSLEFNDAKYTIARWVEKTLDGRVKEVYVQ